MVPVAIAFLIGGLFLHGNWEYTRLLTTIEGGERVLESYNREANVLVGLLDSSSPSFNRTRAAEGVDKWEKVAADRNAELQPWLTRLQGGGIALWNTGTAAVREAAVEHFESWSQHLEAESLDLFYSSRSSRTEAISTTFKKLCDDLENLNSIFVWPTSTRANTMARVTDICDD
jgi:hypothetical protein